MPFYCYQLKSGEIIEEFRSVSECCKIGERTILNDGRKAVRVLEPQGRRAVGEYFICSEKHACLPDQLPEQRAEDRRRGWTGDRNDMGEPVFRNSSDERSFAKAYGLRNSKAYT